ncbi:hypothetical protein F2Q68_00036222 [Brassica cretica]|uniref:Mitochondrial import inner membrane translocase subunit TIM22 n=1 Tax=Brassica cretica TaxID=69181 RepID=A0A8S9GZP2_BRACR|nr:hypothetical protein F2Q68_00036222 [Brassica cretica]
MAITGGEARRVTGDTMAMVRSWLKEMNPALNELKKAVIATTEGAVGGAVFGGMVGMAIIACRNPRALASLSRTQYARVWARDLSAMSAASSGIGSIMRGIRGKDDLTSDMVRGSGSGLAYSFVRQGLKGQPAHAFSWAAGFAVLSGAIYKLEETIRSRKASVT